jgi:hypothetical protein
MTRWLLPLPVLLRLAVTLLRLAAVGLVGIGVSGLLSLLGGWLFGKNFVAAYPSGVTYTPARCRDLYEYAPHARSCQQAAVIHHYGEIVDYRIAAGVLGLVLALLSSVLARRYHERIAAADVLPDGFAATVGASLFAVAGLLLLAQGLGQTAFDQARGAGGPISGALVALPIAVYYALALIRVTQRRTSG